MSRGATGISTKPSLSLPAYDGGKQIKLYVSDAAKFAVETGMGRLFDNIMTAVFSQLSVVLPVGPALTLLKVAVRKTYKSKRDQVRDHYAAARASVLRDPELVRMATLLLAGGTNPDIKEYQFGIAVEITRSRRPGGKLERLLAAPLARTGTPPT